MFMQSSISIPLYVKFFWFMWNIDIYMWPYKSVWPTFNNDMPCSWCIWKLSTTPAHVHSWHVCTQYATSTVVRDIQILGQAFWRISGPDIYYKCVCHLLPRTQVLSPWQSAAAVLYTIIPVPSLANHCNGFWWQFKLEWHLNSDHQKEPPLI